MEDQEYSYTLQSYLHNPAGAGAASTTMRKAVLDGLYAKYDALRKSHKFLSRAYRVGSSIVLVVTVPSESVEGASYDVAIEFEDAEKTNNLIDRKIRIFSNAPSFAFTYAYVMNERELLVPYLRSNLPKKVLSEPPKVRNPDETVNYEKTIVFAMFYIRDNRLFVKDTFSAVLKTSNKISFKKEIRTFDEAMAEYEKRKKVQQQRKAAEREASKAAKAKAQKTTKTTKKKQQRKG